jgi:hypothetical protein
MQSLLVVVVVDMADTFIICVPSYMLLGTPSVPTMVLLVYMLCMAGFFLFRFLSFSIEGLWALWKLLQPQAGNIENTRATNSHRRWEPWDVKWETSWDVKT